jgi:hypothetical protein
MEQAGARQGEGGGGYEADAGGRSGGVVEGAHEAKVLLKQRPRCVKPTLVQREDSAAQVDADGRIELADAMAKGVSAVVKDGRLVQKFGAIVFFGGPLGLIDDKAGKCD